MLGDCRCYAYLLQDGPNYRKAYFNGFLNGLLRQASGPQLVFFDPDIGMEPPGSSQHLYWKEVDEAYRQGHSLLVYQHFRRQRSESREMFIGTRAGQFLEKTGAKRVYSYRTPNVVFFLVPQPAHEALFAHVHDEVANTWKGQIEVSEHSGRGNPA